MPDPLDVMAWMIALGFVGAVIVLALAAVLLGRLTLSGGGYARLGE